MKNLKITNNRFFMALGILMVAFALKLVFLFEIESDTTRDLFFVWMARDVGATLLCYIGIVLIFDKTEL